MVEVTLVNLSDYCDSGDWTLEEIQEAFAQARQKTPRGMWDTIHLSFEFDSGTYYDDVPSASLTIVRPESDEERAERERQERVRSKACQREREANDRRIYEALKAKYEA